MSVATDEAPGIDALSASEQAAVRSAAVWYFKRHARIIADEADDESVRAVARRDDFSSCTRRCASSACRSRSLTS